MIDDVFGVMRRMLAATGRFASSPLCSIGPTPQIDVT
jgi:hypothetical protein